MDVSSISGNSLLLEQQRAAAAKDIDKAEGFAQELDKAQKNTPADPAYQKKMREACQGFEAMFLQMMWREMRNTVPENSLFGESNGEKIFKDMLDTEMVDRISAGGGVGLADIIYDQLTAEYQAKQDMAARTKAAMEAKGQRIDLPG